MKHLLSLFALLILNAVSAQETIFQDNLFNDHSHSVLVQRQDNYYNLKFNQDNPLKLYSWEYETVYNAFKEFGKSNSMAEYKIVQEAGRVFYAVIKEERMTAENSTGSEAGTFGFEKKRVAIQRSERDYRSIYKSEVKVARKEFYRNRRIIKKVPSNPSKDTIVKYKLISGAFRIDEKRNGRKIIDTRIPGIPSYCASRLKRKGLTQFCKVLSSKIDSLFDYHSDSSLINYEKLLLENEQIDKLNRNIDSHKFKISSKERERDNLIATGKSIEAERAEVHNLAERVHRSTGISIDTILDPNEQYRIYTFFIIPGYEKLKQYLDGKPIIRDLKENNERLDNVVKEIVVLNHELLAKNDSLAKSKENVETFSILLGMKGYDRKDKENSFKAKLALKQQKQQDLGNYRFEKMLFEIDSIEVEITKTFIENLVVYGKAKLYDFQKTGITKVENTCMTFFNHVPLGISTLTSIENVINRNKLYGSIGKKMYEMNISEVMPFYRPRVKNNRTDLSPADTSFVIIKKDGMQLAHTYKTHTKRLFEMRVYSDFVGLNGTTPNGLVQTEVSKEMYTNSRKLTVEGRNGLYINWTLGTYITPYVVLSKLEQNNKHLPLYQYADPSVPADSLYAGNSLYATTVQLKRYENFSAGADINLLYFAIPRWKTQFFLDPGIAYGRTGVRDSVTGTDSTRTLHEFGVNTISAKLTLKIVFQTDERYFFDMRAGFQWLNLLNEKVSQTQRFKTSDLMIAPRLDQKMLFTLGLNAGFSPTSNVNGKLFFRYNYFGLVTKHAKDGFSQVQLGYSYYFKN